MARLIVCRDCLSTEVIPDLAKGVQPEEDPILLRITSRHYGPLDREQLSRRPKGASRVRELHPGDPHGPFSIMLVDNIHWNHPDPERRDKIREQVLHQIWADTTGYPPEFYAAKDTYGEDAGYCYNKHRRPGSEKGPHACIDYESDDKRLTDSRWQERGAEVGITRKHVYLCDWCPYSSVVTTRKRMQAGAYDK